MQTTTNTNNYVFFNANDAKVQVYINNVLVGASNNARRLARLLQKHNVNTKTATLMCSSSIDFAAEENFATDACAHNLINSAVKIVNKYCI